MLSLSIRYRNGLVEIEISDNGVGMNRETVARLMGSIEEEAPYFSGKGQSTGLGTHNVFKRLHLFFDGQQLIEIDSSEGQGTAVLFKVPFRTSA